MKLLKFITLVLVLSLASCSSDIDEVIVDQQIPDPDILENYDPDIRTVNSSVTGFVVDEDNTPVDGAAVKLGSQTTTTDTYGHFFFTNTSMNGRGTLVTVEKSGYFDGSRRFFPQDGEKSRVKIQLLDKQFNSSFSSTSGGVVTLFEGSSVQFEATSIETASGTIYDGTVHVAAKWLDPSDLATLDQMPGNLQGVNELSEEVALQSYGMIAVELEGDNGEALNIADGFTAQVSMAVPIAMQANAPTEIPLWSYNESYGVWVEEGTATLQDGKYVVNVEHFSFWNVDYPYELVEFTAQFVNENGAPLVNHLVQLNMIDSWGGFGYTNENGVASGLVPANEAFTLSVNDYYGGVCNGIIYTAEIGPFSSNVDLGQITVEGLETQSFTVMGSLIDCNYEDLTNGLVIVEVGGSTIYNYVDNNPFEFTITTCAEPTEFSIVGVDLTLATQSESQSFAISESIDLGTVSVCDQPLENYIQLTVDGETAFYFDAEAYLNNPPFSATETFLTTLRNGAFVGIGFAGDFPGDYNGELNYMQAIYDTVNEWAFNENFETFNVSEYGAIGENIVGTFSGTLTNEFNGGNEEVSVTGVFNIERTE